MAQGRIVINNDEWTLSNVGFANAPDTPTFVRNVADWFLGGPSMQGNFLAYSTNFGLTESSLAQTMSAAGHTWTVSAQGPLDLATLSTYDGLFVSGAVSVPDFDVLTSYLLGGGNLYLAAGTSTAAMALVWNPFLAGFGFELDPSENLLQGNIATSSFHPIFAGVSALFQNNGQDVIDTRPTSALTSILVQSGGHDIYAAYDGNSVGQSYCSPAIVNSTGSAALIAAQGSASVADLDLVLLASHVPPGQFGYFLASQTQGSFMPPGSQGILCLAGSIGRFNVPAQVFQGPVGVVEVDLTAIPIGPPQAVLPGDTWNFQAWYRDANPGPTSNFTDAISVVFQ